MLCHTTLGMLCYAMSSFNIRHTAGLKAWVSLNEAWCKVTCPLCTNMPAIALFMRLSAATLVALITEMMAVFCIAKGPVRF